MPRRARVILATYDRPRLLRLALRAWGRQTVLDIALTVADDGSGPETAACVAEMARGSPFPIEHVRHERRGFRKAAILNEAVRRAQGEPLLLFTDGDCAPPATFLERHLDAHTTRSLAVGGAWMLSEEASASLTCADVDAGRHERLGTLGQRWKQLERAWKSHYGLWLRRSRRPKAGGANLGIDRALFEAVNGFDETFVGYGLEDSDLRDRVMASVPRPRVRILYGRNDTVHLWHPPSPTAGQGLNRAYYATERPVRCLHGLVDERPASKRAGRSPAVPQGVASR